MPSYRHAQKSDNKYVDRHMHRLSDPRRWLEDQLKPYRERYQEEVIAAEERYAERVNAPLPRAPYPNTNYWDRVGPQIDAHLRYWREKEAAEQLERECDAAEAKFKRETEHLIAMFNERVKGRYAK